MTNAAHRADAASTGPSFSIASYRDADAAQDQSLLFEHLDAFAKAFASMIDRGLDLLQLQAGSALLDVGCGHGAAVPRLAERIGSGGRIVGIDSSRAMIAEAQRRFDPARWPVEFHCADAVRLPFGDAAFDATRCDRVLMFVRDPSRAVAEMLRVTRPDGRVVATEGDIGTHAIDSSDAQATCAVLETVADRVPNGWSGRRLPALFRAAGLRDIAVDLHPYFSDSLGEWSGRIGLEAAVSDAIRRERIEPQRAQRWLDELKARDSCGRFFACGTFVTVAGTR
ncbi:MAG TPA: methyltransferase domain-containing protein [Burkholderiaceae bacterium]|nr:methyltransferase domain-containing protein [Burkholderiaceae bacterium]